MNKLTTYIGLRYPAKRTAEGILKTLERSSEIKTIELLARGNAITRAVDVLEILKGQLNINSSDIKTNTTERTNQNGNIIKTSEITITLQKKSA